MATSSCCPRGWSAPTANRSPRSGDGDAVIFFNFRGDRPREISRAFCEDGFKEFERGKKLDLFFAGLTEYKKGLPIETILRSRRRWRTFSANG